MVVVDLTLATICFMGGCYPALVGSQTPAGGFVLRRQATDEPGYGGDLLVFHEDRESLWAIHRVVPQRGQRRLERLRSPRAQERRAVTRGCINVTPQVYQRLAACCDGELLVILANEAR